MQHTLTFVKDKVKYVSKPFDFEAMCIINDAHNDENKKGPLSICRERAKMCLALWGFYVDALSSKNE